MPITASAIVGTGLGVAQAISSAHKLKKDKEELGRLKPAFYKIQDEYNQNRNLAEQNAGQGLTQNAKDFYTTESQRGLGAGLNTILSSSGSGSDVANLFDTYNRSIFNVAAKDSEDQLNNIKLFMDTNKDLAGQKNIQWSLNEYQPYQAKLKELTERRAADEKSLWGGLGTAVGSLSAGATSMSNNGLMKKLFSNNGNDQQQSTPYDTTPVTNPNPISIGQPPSPADRFRTAPTTSMFDQNSYDTWWNGLSDDEKMQILNIKQ